ncbi:vWA domain-containing protein [Brevibacillus marinus]|uniref:vWA domain-containing protein n=1 Tax=Brevibacillus marinus TaxID=2496837 RepID=UPI000F8303E6|nr:VWA domain-containing protein [Brevibacillus marinus]
MTQDTVLNTDRFDRRRFKSLYEMSANLKQAEEKGGQILPSFYSLMGDMWAGLYKLKPELLSEVDEKLSINYQLMKRLLEDESFQSFREYTKLDDLASAIGTMKFSEQVIEWIKQEIDYNTRQQMQEVSEQQRQADQQQELAQQYQKQAEEAKQAGNTRKANQQQKKANEAQEKANQAQKAAQQLMKQIMQTVSPKMDSTGSYFAKAMQETKELTDNVKDLLSGFKAGKTDADLESVPLRDKLQLAEALKNTSKLKKIAEWAGRFKAIAQKKQRSKTKSAITRKGVTTGNNVEHLLPSEIMFYMNPATKEDFLRRFVEGQTVQYDTRGKQRVGKGPIILCLDQSGSMRKLDEQSKGFALALMMIARKQRRDFALVNFANQAESYEYPNGKMTPQDLIDLATRFLNGGTNFASALNKAVEILKKSRFKQADICFITDGEDHLSPEYLERFNQFKKEKDFHVLSIVLGTENDATVKLFSDHVVRGSTFADERVMDKAFSL